MGDFFRNTLGPGSWMLMGLIPPAIFALYFLKLKRQPLEVPSTYLWHRVIEDLHVNSLWQRLRKSLLLFLQLLMVILAMIALLRPGWQGQTLVGRQFIFLVDNSASMSATDTTAAASRLDDAKEKVTALIDQLEPDMSAMIISFSSEPDVTQQFTNNRRQLKDALATIQPSASTTDLRGALELADGFANPGRVMSEDGGTEFEVTEQQDVELFIFSDGRFPRVSDFSLGNLQPQFLPTGSFESQNIAITAFNTSRSEERPELQQAFVKVVNFSDEPQNVVVELYLNDQLLDASDLELTPSGTSSTTFNLGVVSEGELTAKLGFSDSFNDKLEIDNVAYAVLEDNRDAKVLFVSPGNTALEVAFSTERARRLANVEKLTPSELQTADYKTVSLSESYDLIVFDQCKPDSMPLANTVFIGRIPPIEDWTQSLSEKVLFAPQIIDWQRSHPLLNLVELGNVQIVDTFLAKPPLGGLTLIDSTLGPLMSISPREQYEDLVLGFEIVGKNEKGIVTFNTDWPRKHSFPNFWFNVLDYFSRSHGNSVENHTPEKLVQLRVPGYIGEFELELPDGTTQEIFPDRPGQVSIIDTSQLGIYHLKQNGESVKSFVVNLFNREESDIQLKQKQDEQIKVVDSLSIGYVDVQASSANTPIRRELWKALLFGALVVLVLEWYIYNQRVYI